MEQLRSRIVGTRIESPKDFDLYNWFRDNFFDITKKYGKNTTVGNIYRSQFSKCENIDLNIFKQDFIKNEAKIYLIMPFGEFMEFAMWEVTPQDAKDYLSDSETIDNETDVYIISESCQWIIRYIDEFIDNDNRKIFYEHD